MSEDKRRGHKLKRKSGCREPDLGYYIVVCDTEETEENYINGLRDSIPIEMRDRIVIKIQKTKTGDLINKCCEWLRNDPQNREPWIMFDRDKVVDFDEIICEAKSCGISVAWSNPCIEIWFYSYFGAMPTCMSSKDCLNKFKMKFKQKTGTEYEKENKEIYNKLCTFGDEQKAIKLAKQKFCEISEEKNKPSEMSPCTTVHQLVGEIKRKTRA